MTNNSSNIYKIVEKDFLPFVQRPGRYIDHEINSIKKNTEKCDITVALCFPDTYEVGMSNTGLSILYSIINKLPWAAAERVFSPWTDAEEIMRKKNIPLFSLETNTPLKEFDIIGFSLTNELCYTNLLNALDLANLKVRSENRKENDPIILAGGGMTNCCEPVADFIDMALIGEAEDAMPELLEFIRSSKSRGLTKDQIVFEAAKKFKWLYVPFLYDIEYSDQGIKKIKPKEKGLSILHENAVVKDFENTEIPLNPVVPYTQAVHERISIEVMRGCPGRCSFCQASFTKRPIRYRSPERILEAAKKIYQNTGYDTVSLLSLSTADYPHLDELVKKLNNYFADKYVGISVPSLRVDQQLKLLPQMVDSVRKANLTIAVEAASERLRNIINKPLKNEDLFDAVESAYEAGWNHIKLYFMVGLPGETEKDIREIVNLSYKLAKIRKHVDGKTGNIDAAVSWMVPKPHTPLGWMGQKSAEYFRKVKEIILQEKYDRNARFLFFKFHNIERSTLESAMSRGDRRLANVIEQAWKNGARFDLWDEHFDFETWKKAFEKFGMSLNRQAQKTYETKDILPWQHLGGPDTEYIIGHYNDVIEKLD